MDQFPFPSTGKALPNINRTSCSSEKILVSIPFNREGIAELTMVFELAVEENYETFPFPSTGKAFPNVMAYATAGAMIIAAFPFPSTGKAFPNEKRGRDVNRHRRTGRFHSLQPGRHFRTGIGPCVRTWGQSVSIPFNREGIAEHLSIEATVGSVMLFPFPSTGKALPN